MRTLLFALALLLCACGGTSAAAKPLTAGQTAHVGDLVITYTGARVLPDDPVSLVHPEAGKQYLAVSLTVENRSKSAAQINALTFAVVDHAGGRWLQGFVTPSTSDPGIDGVLPAGETVRGAIVVEVPKDAAPYRLRYTRLGTTQTATWAITLP